MDAQSRIAQLNDADRTGRADCRLMLTSGVTALGEAAVKAILKKVVTFSEFNESNDPYGEHDFGKVQYASKAVFWKFEYYGLDMNHGSDDPADHHKTARVLTIVLADEY